jgi:uncharacterized protein
MKCNYCYSKKSTIEMSEKTLCKAIDFSLKYSKINTGLIFFGGEPLLKKDLIYKGIEYSKKKDPNQGYGFHYKITTNGLLLDDNFIQYAKENRISIGLSLDGVEKAHDYHRVGSNGEPTFSKIEKKLDKLLNHHQNARIYMTITPETAPYYYQSVKYIFSKGFRYLLASLDYSSSWMDRDLKVLKQQYKKIAKLYEEMSLREEKFYFGPFETKFQTHIKGEDAHAHRCTFGLDNLSIAPNGDIYPCLQFVQDSISNKDYIIGNIYDGFDNEKRSKLINQAKIRDYHCESCGFKFRCNNNCSCLNWQTTDNINTITPFLCESERLLIDIVDRLGEKLFKKGVSIFIQKHYNMVYPIISMAEDHGKN